MTSSELVKRGPQFVVGITVADRHNILRDPGGNAILHNPDFQVIELPISGGESELVQTLHNREQLRQNEVLVRDPFDANKYLPINQLADEAPLKKFFLFFEFCMLLGAKHVHIEHKEQIDTEEKTESKYSAANMNYSGYNALVAKLRKSISMQGQFNDGEPDFEEAYNLMLAANLTDDMTFATLYRMRRRKKHIEKLQLELSLTTEVRRSLERFWKVQLPKKLGELNPGITSGRQELKEYLLTVVVEFGSPDPTLTHP